jgi:hypothetical protein
MRRVRASELLGARCRDWRQEAKTTGALPWWSLNKVLDCIFIYGPSSIALTSRSC